MAPALLGLSVGASALATGVLTRALVVNDFSLAYVADFSRAEASAPYRIAALWGGMAGSLLWFATLTGAAGLAAALATYPRTVPGEDPPAGHRSAGDAAAGHRATVAGVTGGVVAVLAGLVLAFADPFAPLDVPAIGGAGLTPILEHPAMLYHPPLLYLGLATLVSPYALTLSALARRRVDDTWAATVRRWFLVPWTLLAVGMLAGAHWAYVELGWGGYWAWDPVENTALLPWLAVTLWLHASRRAATLPCARPPTGLGLAGLACLPFLLGLVGTLLTRSGATSSVHAFAESRAIGRALGVMVAVAAVAVVALVAWMRWRGTDVGSTAAVVAAPLPDAPHADDLRPDNVRPGNLRPVTPPGADRRPPRWAPTIPALLAGHAVVVGGLLAIVLAGTLWPLWADLTGGDGFVVEGRYFASFAGPLAAAGLALLAAFPVVRASGPDRRRLVAAASAGAVAGVVCAWAAGPGPPGSAAVALMGLGGMVVATSTLAAVRRLGGRVAAHAAHAGLALLLVGVGGTTAGETTTIALGVAESVEVAGYTVTHHGVRVTAGPARASSAVVADVDVEGRRLAPTLVAFPERNVLLAETSLISRPTADVQVALRDARDDGTALLEIGVHPFQVLVWWGGLVLTAAGASALRGPRPGVRRSGAPRRDEESAVVTA